MIKKVQNCINRNQLLTNEGLHLVALSGGADSVALLRVLLLLGYKTEAVHCNFHLRDEESDRDEEFCKQLCKSLGVPIHLAHFDTHAYASLHHVSIEMAARDLRYRYFEQLRLDLNAESICVAHHKDDQAETILLNLIRGTGLQGLTGMRKKHDFIVRPMLCVSREEILKFLGEIGQSYITDSSNLKDDVKRNKLRLNIIPLLREINPSVVDSLCNMANHVSDSIPYTHESLEEYAHKVCSEYHTQNDSETDKSSSSIPTSNEFTINIDRLRQSPNMNYLLYFLLENKGFNPAVIDNICDNLDSRSGTLWESKTHQATVNNKEIFVNKKESLPKPFTFPEEGIYNLPDGKKISLKVIDKIEIKEFKSTATSACFDLTSIHWPLTIRCIEDGERFIPYGMKGTKLINDLLAENKVPLPLRKKQLVLVDNANTPLWVIGYRTDDRAKITDNTIKCLFVSYI